MEPYKRTPAPPRVAVLTDEGAIVDEDGAWFAHDDVPAGTRVFGQWDVVRLLMNAGVGEALCWNNEEIRWRLEPHPAEQTWRAQPGDVYVLRLPLTETLTPAVLLGALVQWRDWMVAAGAAPTGTTGSAAMSLLRARLEGRLVTGIGERPPLLQTRGGRMQLGPTGQGRHEGRLVLYDMPAAYASLLGAVSYGGVWQRVDHSGREFGYWLEVSSDPLFVRADVRIPRTGYGPLLRCFTRRVHYAEMEVYGRARYPDGSPWLYPVGRKISGVWTREELLGAVEAGCAVSVRDAWVHRAPERPFAPWWAAVEQGRAELTGTAAALVKMTGNALWGRFAMDPRVAGRRTIRGRAGVRELRQNPFQWPAHDLAEYVSGTVRARLYRLIVWAGERLLAANTDGAWCVDDGSEPPPGWRVKARAHRLDLLQPTCLRYWPERSRWPRTVFAGVPAIEAATAFERAWADYERSAAA